MWERKAYCKVHYLLFFSILLPFTAGASSELKGTEFWLGFMENQISTSECRTMLNISSEVNTSGSVSIPLAGWSIFFTIEANSFQEVCVPTELVEAIGDMSKENKGIYIQAQDSVYVSAISRTGGSNDASSIMPMEHLGYEYIVTTYIDPPNKDWGTPEFLIVATEDNTQIEIALAGVTSLGQDTPFVISLNRGQTYQVQSTFMEGVNWTGDDLTGSSVKVLCNEEGRKNPIAVFSGALCSVVQGCSGCDHLYEQMLDISTWGTNFIIVPPETRETCVYKIVASKDGTLVSINNAVPIALNTGEQYETVLSGNAYVSASEPINISQFTPGQDCSPTLGDPLMMLLSPIDKGVSNFEFYAYSESTLPNDSTSNSNYATIITATSAIDQVKLDGEFLNASIFEPFLYNPDFSVAKVYVGWKRNIHYIESSESFMAYIYGFGGANSYGYGSNVAASIIHNETFQIGYLLDTAAYRLFNDTVCACEPISFLVPDYHEDYTYRWSWGDGGNGIGDIINHNYLNGIYTVTLSIEDPEGCVLDTLVKQKIVVKNCDISVEPDQVICPGDSVTLSAQIGTSFEWGNGDTNKMITIAPDQTSTFSIKIDDGNSPTCDSIIIYVNKVAPLNLEDTIQACSGESIHISSENYYNDYFWSTSETTAQIQVQETGDYWLKVVDKNNCELIDTTTAIIYEIPNNHLMSDTTLCLGNALHIEVPEISGLNYFWSNGATGASIEIDSSGLFWVESTNGLCSSRDTVEVFFHSAPSLSHFSDTTLCARDVKLDAKNPGSTYLWSTGSTQSYILPAESATYHVSVQNNCGSVQEFITVQFDCSFQLYIPNSFTPNDDGYNDVFICKGENISHFKMMIYNKWGEMIFESNDIQTGWDGKFPRSKPYIHSNVYSYMVEFKDPMGKWNYQSGHIHLTL